MVVETVAIEVDWVAAGAVEALGLLVFGGVCLSYLVNEFFDDCSDF